ncbi:MAG: fatty acid cis/trans isomerase [Oligoflexia bacterium]|nr:fatty acid cis/trans isomerase [Oligoflexia bacterium]
MKNTWKILLGAAGLGAAMASFFLLHEQTHPTLPVSNPAADTYYARIQPIFNSRCIVCHSCYNSPCQLNLTAFEGYDRGATQALVYDAERLRAIHPTRLFEDAQTTHDWQTRLGFFPAAGQMSLLLAHKYAHPHTTGAFHAELSHSCPRNPAETQDYLRDKPEGGMPFGFPALSPSEYETLADWLNRGAPGPKPETLAALLRPATGAAGERVLEKWESFLNQPDAKTRITARYLYEHLFLAHLRFDEIPGDFYRLVRSRTAWPEPVDEIATVRPYDDPRVPRVYYRFRRITQTIVRKTHINYLLNDAKIRRFRELFLDSDWGTANPTIPSYAINVASNPFIAFQSIPARARYQFLLDDAYYHVMSFIRGPVCKGNVALNVIEPHFQIMFLDPGSDLTVTHPEFLPQVADLLKLPAQGEDGARAIYARYKYDQMKYQEKRQALYQRFGSQGLSLKDLWDGDGSNDSALLTVYRHVDSADVLKGAWGGIPKTTWVMDYPIFERIYYDLVSGFDVYGNIMHQVSTRMYMDNLRIESEDLFLSFLPKAQRPVLRRYWYRGPLSEAVMKLLDPLYEKNIETRIVYHDPAHAKEEFLSKALNERFNARVRGKPDPINSHGPNVAPGEAAIKIRDEHDLERELAKVTRTPGEFTQLFPDVSLIRVRHPEARPSVYTMIHNKEQLNVSFMFIDTLYRDPAADDLHILKGIQGSYPNFFFDVPVERLGDFLKRVRAVGARDGSFERLIDDYGVRRMDPRFWKISDWFNAYYRSSDPIEAGVLDLSRYENF